MTRLHSTTSNQTIRYIGTGCHQQDVAQDFVPEPDRYQSVSLSIVSNKPHFTIEGLLNLRECLGGHRTHNCATDLGNILRSP
jgi:hypothetical protein